MNDSYQMNQYNLYQKALESGRLSDESIILAPQLTTMVAIITSKDQFEQILASGSVVVDFFADWCGPCRSIAPKFEELAKANSDITFIKIDVDNESMVEVCEKYGISSLPTILFFKNQEVVETVIGANIQKIEKSIALLK